MTESTLHHATSEEPEVSGLKAVLMQVYLPLPDSVRAALDEDFLASDRFFLRFFIGHWAIATLLVSLYHGTYLLGFVGGGAIVGLSYFATKAYGGTALSRSVNAACLMLFSVLFIQQSGGRIEMHFHVFMGIAVFIRYKDVVPTLVGAGTIAVHHLTFNYCQQFGVSIFDAPIIVFDYGTGLDIVLLHATFVIAGVGVNSYIIYIYTRQFIAASAMADENERMAAARDRSLVEAEQSRKRERAQAEELASKVDQILVAVDSAAGGNLSAHIPVQGHDAVGRVGSGLSALLHELSDSMRAIAAHAESLGEASNELSTVSSQLESNAHVSSDRASDASGQAAQLEQAIQSVAGGSEELAVSIAEVASQAERADEVADRAGALIEQTHGMMHELSSAGKQIGSVMQMISNIAAQTNLLALNATIEAANAGEAGRGFAVVASEVKSLAVDTSKATDDVRSLVESIQMGTEEAVSAMGQIQSVMAEVKAGSQTIVTTASQQRTAATQISQSIAEAAEASTEITRTMDALGSTAQNTSQGAERTRGSASQLVDMASGLRQLVRRFQVV